jgi:DNA repair protein RadC
MTPVPPSDLAYPELLVALLGNSARGFDVENLARIVRGEPVVGRTARRVALAIELGRRALRASVRGEDMRNPRHIAAWASARLGGVPHEELWLLCLSSKHRLVRAVACGAGGPTTLSVATSTVLRDALLVGAPYLVLVHNHPSGDTTPSKEDVEMTHGLWKASRVVGLNLLDHVITGGPPDVYTSLYEQGLLSPAEEK